MLNGEIRSKIDALWNAFWTGGISNPLEVIEQITYLLFLKRLDDLHTLEENKAARLKLKKLERRIFPEGKDPKGRAYDDLRWSRFKHFEAKEMFEVVDQHVFPFLRTLGVRRLHLRASHEGRALHHPHARAPRQGRGHD